jgi:hypothetical protein
MHTQQSACLADILSDCSVDWIPYYIPHMNMDAHPYVLVPVFVDYSCRCMPYYTHHKPKGTNHYVCGDG